MKEILYSKTLFYFDGPQVFEARDKIGGNYLAVAIGEVDGAQKFVVVGVEPELLRQFKTGSSDLRSLLLESSKTCWYTAFELPEGGKYALMEGTGPLESFKEYLPEPGFSLHHANVSDQVVIGAREQANLFLEVVTEPPEAAIAHQIKASTLSGLLFHIQRTMKWAYAASFAGKNTAEPRGVDRRDGEVMHVMATAAGSFKVLLTPAKPPVMHGISDASRALHILDILMSNPDDTLSTQRQVGKFKGHLARAYIDLLGFLADNNTGLSYSWAEPADSVAKRRSVSLSQARSLHKALSKDESLSVNIVVVRGVLVKANKNTGSWGLDVGYKVEKGNTAETGPGLGGLVIGKSYQFKCQEETSINPSTGKEQINLSLIECEEHSDR